MEFAVIFLVAVSHISPVAETWPTNQSLDTSPYCALLMRNGFIVPENAFIADCGVTANSTIAKWPDLLTVFFAAV